MCIRDSLSNILLLVPVIIMLLNDLLHFLALILGLFDGTAQSSLDFLLGSVGHLTLSGELDVVVVLELVVLVQHTVASVEVVLSLTVGSLALSLDHEKDVVFAFFVLGNSLLTLFDLFDLESVNDLLDVLFLEVAEDFATLQGLVSVVSEDDDGQVSTQSTFDVLSSQGKDFRVLRSSDSFSSVLVLG